MKENSKKPVRSLGGIVPPAGREELLRNTAPGAGMGRDLVQERDGEIARILPETTVIIHELDDDADSWNGTDGYIRTRGVVHRAMELLHGWKFLPARISSSRVPVDIIAIRGDIALLAQVISSKKPIPDAKTLVRHYAARIDALRQMGTGSQFRKIVMATSKLCGWKYYEVFPGGLIPAWNLPGIEPA